MGFFTVFKNRTPDIINRLNNIKTELNDARCNLEKMIADDERLMGNADQLQSERLVESAVENFGVAMWLKDLDSKFVYVNKKCCEVILHCTEKEALSATDTDFEENALAGACLESDLKVLSSQTTRRFVEHGLYQEKHVFLDTIKSPLYYKKKLIGTMGSGKDITIDIPVVIKEKLNSCSVEIPTELVLCEENIKEYLSKCE